MNRHHLLGLSIGLLVLQPVYGTDTIIPFIGADAVHAQGILGQGVTVVVIDGGIHSNHPGLQGSIAGGGVTFANGIACPDGGEAEPSSDHGTVVSLEITDPTGVAPSADILSVRVFSPMASGDWDDIREAIKYAKRQRQSDPSIRVINMSLGGGAFTCPCDNDAFFIQELQAAISAAEIAGILSFAASGNDAACGFIGAPACTTGAIPVAASYDANYDPEDFGVCIDIDPQPNWVVCFSDIDNCDFFLAAPGYDINVGGFVGWHGTSMATPVCSGVAALMWSKGGCGLSAAQVRNAIFGTALPFSWAFPFCSFWAPDHVNAIAAVNAIPAATTPGTGDFDCDGVVSGDDFLALGGCLTGPGGGPVTSFCVAGDYPESPPDGDVDLRDFAQFQMAFTGYGVGACCHLDGTCTEGPITDCREEFFAFYQGHGTTCATTVCTLPPWGACCDLVTGVCTIMAEDDCNFSNGIYQGDGTDCATTTCPVVRYDNTIDPLTTFISSPTGIMADDVTLDGAGGCVVRQYTVGVFGGFGGPFDVTVGLYDGSPLDAGLLIAGTEFTFSNLPDNGSPVFVSPIVDPPVSIPQSVWIKVDFNGNTSAGWFRAEQAEIGFTADFYARYDPPWNLYFFGGPPNPWAGFWATIACDSTGSRSEGNESVVLTEPAAEPESRPGSRLVLMAPPGQRLPEPIFRAAITRERSSPKSEGPLDERLALPYAGGADQSRSGLRAGNVTLGLDSPSAGQSVLAGDSVQWSVTATLSSGDNAGLALVSVDLEQDVANPEMFDIPLATVVGVGMAGFQRPDGIDNPGPGGAGSAYGGTQIGTPGAMNLVQIGGAQNTFGVTGDIVGTDVVVDPSIGQGAAQLVAQGSFLAPSTDGTYLFTLANGLANVLDVANPPPSPPEFWPVSGATVILGQASFSFTVGAITCTPSDMNNDGTVDGRDFQLFVRVFVDPGSASSLESCAADVNEDGVLDNNDAAAFINNLLGVPGV